MNRPSDRGSAIDAKRYRLWVSRFAGYRNPVTQPLIELWLAQFSRKDRDLAARTLGAVLFMGQEHIHSSFRRLLLSLDGWHKSSRRRKGRWFFVPFSGSSGESGDSMLHVFRMATSLTARGFNELFIHRSELVAKNPTPGDTVVLIDDFSGTGTQACDSWKNMFAELLAGGPRIVLMLIAATEEAFRKITAETEMEPLCGAVLSPRYNLFGDSCEYFCDGEKSKLLRYCRRANRSLPKGYGECGLLVVFAHQCPNNSIPILHASHDTWQGLFPRR